MATGGQRQTEREAERKGKKYKAFAMGGFRTEINGSGDVQAVFELSKDGRKIIEILGRQNLAKKKGVIPLNASLFSFVLPADGQGTGGSLEDIKFK